MKKPETKYHRPFIHLILKSIAFAFMIAMISNQNSNAASAPVFAKNYHTAIIGKKITCQIKNLKKADTISYSVSNRKLASIDKKQGILVPKKEGTITVKAIIYRKKKKLKTLINKIAIIKNETILPNASFQIQKTINPWDFTLTLSCSRILLKKEIKNSNLTILPKGKSTPKLKANYTKLSPDGKTVTYTLISSSQKKLCPGDDSMNGTYTLQSDFFQKKLSLSYQERLSNDTLSGFVLHPDGSPINNALVSLKTKSDTKQCYSDENGHYKISGISNPVSLTAKKDGFQTVSVSNITSRKKGVSCENILMHPKTNTSLTIEFRVTDQENHPVSNASIYLQKDTEEIKGKTDSSGSIFLTHNNELNNFPTPCTNFSIDRKKQLSYTSSYCPSLQNQLTLPSDFLNTSDTYTAYVSKSSFQEKISSLQPQKISFSFADLITSHLLIQVTLFPCPSLTVPSFPLPYNIPLPSSSFSFLTLQFFQTGQSKSFFSYQIKKNSFHCENDKIFLPSLLLPISLSDGSYCLQLQVLSKENEVIGESPVLPITIKDAHLAIPENSFSIFSPRFARMLVYGKFTDKKPVMASFHLYQKYKTQYFFIGTISSDLFIQHNTGLYSASLIIPHLITGQDYLLSTNPDENITKTEYTFSANSKNTFPTIKEAVHSISPLAQILCTAKTSLALPGITSPVTSDDTLHADKIPDVSASFTHEITQNFVRSCTNYPNCVIAFYRLNGTFLTASFTNQPTHNTINTSIPLSNPRASIIDIYTNKKTIVTNQKPYQSK